MKIQSQVQNKHELLKFVAAPALIGALLLLTGALGIYISSTLIRALNDISKIATTEARAIGNISQRLDKVGSNLLRSNVLGDKLEMETRQDEVIAELARTGEIIRRLKLTNSDKIYGTYFQQWCESWFDFQNRLQQALSQHRRLSPDSVDRYVIELHERSYAISNILAYIDSDIDESLDEARRFARNATVALFVCLSFALLISIIFTVIIRKIVISSRIELDIEKAKSQQSAKLATLGELSAGIAHEISNPLAIISATTQLLPKHYNDLEGLNNRIKAIERAVARATKIVGGLRKFSRLANPSDFSSHSLRDLIRESIVLVEAKARTFQTPVSLDCISEARVACDEVEIGQVFINMIGNAIDAICDQDEKWVKISVSETENEVVVQIRDSGKGIPPDIAKKLFDPFFTTKPAGVGTGLGLSITTSILTRHNATIKIVEKDPNTCFEIRFQRVAATPQANPDGR